MRHPFMRFMFPVFLLALAALSPSQAATPELALPGSDGQEHRPLTVPADKKAVVLLFGSPFCNTANTFLPEFNAITEAYEGDFTFYLIHSERDLELTQVMEHKELLNLRATALLDKAQHLVKHTHARVTPEVVVIAPDGKTLYQGRINDLYLGPTKRQRHATTADLRDALDAILAGKPLSQPKTEAMGCKISGVE
jgi:thioredoxin-related protein